MASTLDKQDSKSSSQHFEEEKAATHGGPDALTQGDRALEMAQDRVVVTEEDVRLPLPLCSRPGANPDLCSAR